MQRGLGEDFDDLSDSEDVNDNSHPVLEPIQELENSIPLVVLLTAMRHFLDQHRNQKFIDALKAIPLMHKVSLSTCKRATYLIKCALV